jgi:hypothetical protein
MLLFIQTSNSVIDAKNIQAAKAVYEAALVAQSALGSQAAQVHVQTAVNTQFNGGGHASYAHPFPPARPIEQRIDFDTSPAPTRQASGAEIPSTGRYPDVPIFFSFHGPPLEKI